MDEPQLAGLTPAALEKIDHRFPDRPAPAVALPVLTRAYLRVCFLPSPDSGKDLFDVRTENLSLRVQRSRDRFAVSGKVRLDEDRVLDFEQLLRHSRLSGDNFVALDDGTYVELTEALRERAAAMEALLHDRKGGAALPQLAVGAFAELTDDLEELELDAHWQERLDRLRAAESF